MRIQYLIIVLVLGMFSSQCWAPPIKSGATGGAAAAPDISKCDLNPSEQTKLQFKNSDGKDLFICTGQAICAGKAVPVSCKVSDREPCPVSKICISFDDLLDLPGDGWVRIVECVPGPDNGYYQLNKPYKFKAIEKVGGKWVPANNIEWTFGGAPYQEIWRAPDSIEVKFTKAQSRVQAKVKSKKSMKEFYCAVHSVR